MARGARAGRRTPRPRRVRPVAAARRPRRAGSWAWSDLVVVTDDPGDPALSAPRRSTTPALFFGDPAALAPDVARHVAVVTTAPVAASDLTVLVDRQAATLHPVGRVLRPDLQSAETDRLITELVTPPTDSAGVAGRRAVRVAGPAEDEVRAHRAPTP